MTTTRILITIFHLSLLTQISLADDHFIFDIVPASFLSGVTPANVQMTCRPPATEDVVQVMVMQIYKQRGHQGGLDSIATYVTTASSPVVEAFGAFLNASAYGSYDAAHPKTSFLRVDLFQPTDDADGNYTCTTETLDSQGLLHRHSQSAPLTFLDIHTSVPDLYKTILQEVRAELDDLTSDLFKVAISQWAVNSRINQSAEKLTTINSDYINSNSLLNDINSTVTDVSQQIDNLRSELDRLRELTPETAVSFYAYLSSTTYVTFADNTNIIFNTVEHHTDNSYSITTGEFTAPVNGTYKFITGITGQSNILTTAAITVGNQEVSSLFAIDDYQLNQATATAVVQLLEGDEVKIVKKSGPYIYGTNYGNHITYFAGMLLW